jgi:hypothetical protein
MRCECDTCFCSLRFSVITLLQRTSQPHGLAVVWPDCTFREAAAAPAASNPSQGTGTIVPTDDIMVSGIGSCGRIRPTETGPVGSSREVTNTELWTSCRTTGCNNGDVCSIVIGNRFQMVQHEASWRPVSLPGFVQGMKSNALLLIGRWRSTNC